MVKQLVKPVTGLSQVDTTKYEIPVAAAIPVSSEKVAIPVIEENKLITLEENESEDDIEDLSNFGFLSRNKSKLLYFSIFAILLLGLIMIVSNNRKSNQSYDTSSSSSIATDSSSFSGSSYNNSIPSIFLVPKSVAPKSTKKDKKVNKENIIYDSYGNEAPTETKIPKEKKGKVEKVKSEKEVKEKVEKAGKEVKEKVDKVKEEQVDKVKKEKVDRIIDEGIQALNEVTSKTGKAGEKEEKVDEIIDEGIEAFNGIKSIFADVGNAPSPLNVPSPTPPLP